MKKLCIYHGNCADGFTSAWVVRKALGENVEFHAGIYQNPPPDVAGRDVIIVDFSYKRPVMQEIIAKAGLVTVLDHHKTAQADLDGLDGCRSGVEVMFDMERSGATMAWDWFFPHEPTPQLIKHVEDRDLWRFALSGTREIQASVFAYPYEFTVWDFLMGADLEELRMQGEAIERKHFKDIRELVGVVTRNMKIGGHVVPVANLPYTLTSDAGHLLAKDKPFAGCFWFTPDGWVFSLRSREDGADVGEIAKQYGGGGHKHAAGFRIPLNKLGDFCEAINAD